MTLRLTEEQIEDLLSKHPGWKRLDHKWIEKRFRFKEFMDAIHFVNQVAELAEQEQHHPMIAIDYKLVTLKLTTWAEGGLTELDVQSVQEIEKIYQNFSSKS
jgi:4a-hydroxytetrahydrobiopterin dehydratase